MCNQQTGLANSQACTKPCAGPATAALKRANDDELQRRAAKRRRSEDSATLEATKVSVDFDMSAVFAQLPTNDEAFPKISWDFDDGFADSMLPSTVLPFNSERMESSPLFRSLCTYTYPEGESIKSRVPSKSLTALNDAHKKLPLGKDLRLAGDIGEAILRRGLPKGAPMETVSLKGLLNEAPMLAFSVNF